MARSELVIPVLLAALPLLPAQDEPPQPTGKPPGFIAAASDEASQQMRTFQLAPGLEVELVAAEPDLCNVVAFQVDEHGRIWVAETFRINDGVFDTRGHMQWKDEDLACRTVEDRLAMYRRHIADKIEGYAAFPERIRLLQDRNGDGVMDQSTVFADSFRDLADGIASGVLFHQGDVWFTNIPKLWRLRDTDGDGRADQQEAVSDGWGVHVSLIGHDMHGLVIGPDRRLYFSIGDRGFHVRTREGALLDHPHEGAVLRCELDGSHLEVFHRGLRNPQELAFDDRGDLFSGDNNSDGGDKARFVFVVEGGDSGWRIGHQWVDDRGRWNREKLWHPPFPGQAAWIVPPIANIADGPSGLVYDTGLGLPDRYRGHFFLCDFRGAPAPSGLRAIRLEPRGAGFEVARLEQPVWRILCTDVDIGPDGSLYLSDWVNGWNKTGKGRIYRVRTAGQRNDLRLRTLAQDLASDLGRLRPDQLLPLLDHQDRRMRQKAQFALVDQGARDVLAAAAAGPDRQRARLHGIWGLGILGRSDPQALAPVVPLLGDGDAEVRAQGARVLGDARWGKNPGAVWQEARDRLVQLVQHDPNSRVRLQAAIALGKFGPGAAAKATPAILAALRHCGDRDPWLRHGLALALAGLDDRAVLHRALADDDVAVRLGAVLALRRLADPELASALRDPDLLVRTEAASAIHDAPVDAALPALAALIDGDLPADGPLTHRVLHGNRLLGQPEHGLALLAFATDARRGSAMRIEALAMLGEWPAPHGQDRIDGNWRPVTHPDPARVVEPLAAALPGLLADRDHGVAQQAATVAGQLRVAGAAAALATLVGDAGRPVRAREAALRALDTLDAPELDAVVDALPADAPGGLREAAVRIFARRNPDKAVPVLASLLQNGSRRERRGAFAALGDLGSAAAADLLLQALDDLAAGKVDAAVQLELLEAAQKRQEDAVRERLERRTAAFGDDPLLPFQQCLQGGDAEQGRQVFFQDERANCQRCHSIGGRGGSAGPRLDGIGAQRDRTALLRSLLAPSAEIAEGYASVVLHLHNGELLAGIVTRDQDGVVEVTDVDGKATQVPNDRIKERVGSTTSAMPPMGGILSPRQVRDLVEFLATRKDS